MARGQGFGMWYVTEPFPENYKAEEMWTGPYAKEDMAGTWNKAMRKEGLNFYGYKNRFEGFGIVFTSDAVKNVPKIYCVSNDHSKVLNDEASLGVPKNIDFMNKDFLLHVNVMGPG